MCLFLAAPKSVYFKYAARQQAPQESHAQRKGRAKQGVIVIFRAYLRGV